MESDNNKEMESDHNKEVANNAVIQTFRTFHKDLQEIEMKTVDDKCKEANSQYEKAEKDCTDKIEQGKKIKEAEKEFTRLSEKVSAPLNSMVSEMETILASAKEQKGELDAKLNSAASSIETTRTDLLDISSKINDLEKTFVNYCNAKEEVEVYAVNEIDFTEEIKNFRSLSKAALEQGKRNKDITIISIGIYGKFKMDGLEAHATSNIKTYGENLGKMVTEKRTKYREDYTINEAEILAARLLILTKELKLKTANYQKAILSDLVTFTDPDCGRVGNNNFDSLLQNSDNCFNLGIKPECKELEETI